MRNNLYAPIRCCADGSIRTVRHESLKTFLTEVLAAILLASFFILTTMFILTDPLELFAPQSSGVQNISVLKNVDVSQRYAVDKVSK